MTTSTSESGHALPKRDVRDKSVMRSIKEMMLQRHERRAIRRPPDTRGVFARNRVIWSATVAKTGAHLTDLQPQPSTAARSLQVTRHTTDGNSGVKQRFT
jgi:hypothetical protein